MKRHILWGSLIAVLILVACERDDICAATTLTTPLLVIDFYDANNTALPKVPVNLEITPDIANATAIAVVNAPTISLPLRTSEDDVNYFFKINSLETDTEEENTDRLAINYNRTEDFVSSACGYRVIYNALDVTQNPLADGSWIQDIDILNTIVDNDTITHVTIFH